MKFVDVKNDVAFRKIFGNEKKTKILISFLNAALKLEGDHLIKEVVIANPYQFPRIAGEKASIIDVRAKDVRGRQFVVEMQVAETDGFDKRVQYYTCRDYSMQIDRGEEYPKLKPTYFIGILDFDYFESEDYLSHHLLLNGKTYEHKLKDIQFTFIELEEVQQRSSRTGNFDRKVDILHQAMPTNSKSFPDNVDDDGLLEAYHDADRHSWKKEELIAYDNASIAEQDEKGRMKLVADRAKKEVIKRCVEESMKLNLLLELQIYL